MDYQNGKIYKITNCIDNEVYIGSTTQPLTKRWYGHKQKMKCGTIYKIYQHMSNLGVDKFSISLVENYPCTNKSELLRREGELIREQGTLNSQISGRTIKEYVYDNKEKIEEYKKQWTEDNKKYYKDYYENNKEIIRNFQNRKVECDLCNKTVSFGNLPRHKKSTACVAVSVGNMNVCKGSQA